MFVFIICPYQLEKILNRKCNTRIYGMRVQFYRFWLIYEVELVFVCVWKYVSFICENLIQFISVFQMFSLVNIVIEKRILKCHPHVAMLLQSNDQRRKRYRT